MINIRKINITKKFFIKLFSFFFAVFLWFFVVNEEKTEINISVPIEITKLPQDYVVEGLPPSIMISLYGPRSIIQILTGQKMTKTLELEHIQKGPLTIQLTPESIAVPSGVKITKIQPSKLELSVSRFIKKEVPVKLYLTGTPHQDFKLVDTEILPPKITIYGAEETVEKVKSIETPPVDISNHADTFNRIVKLDFKDLGFTSEISNLFLKIKIEPEQGNLHLSRIPVVIDSDLEGVHCVPKYAEISLEGPKNLLKNTKSEDILLKISVKGLEKGQHYLKPIPYIPSGLYIKEIKPLEFQVVIPDENKSHEKGSKKDAKQR